MVNLEQDRCEYRPVGCWLREARELRGESLDDASKITRIGRNYLAAIEQGEFHKLPSDAYVRGFIRLYANHLGLSGDEALSRLAVTAPAEGGAPPESAAGDNTLRRSIGKKKWAVPLFLLAVLAIATLPRMMPPKRTLPVAETAPKPAATVAGEGQPATAATPNLQKIDPLPVAGENQTKETESALSGSIVLRLKAVQNGKLHITIDGSVSQEYDLNVGDLVEWKAETMFLLELDNAGSVEAELNGKPLQPFGDSGRSVQLTIRADGIHKD